MTSNVDGLDIEFSLICPVQNIRIWYKTIPPKCFLFNIFESTGGLTVPSSTPAVLAAHVSNSPNTNSSHHDTKVLLYRSKVTKGQKCCGQIQNCRKGRNLLSQDPKGIYGHTFVIHRIILRSYWALSLLMFYEALLFCKYILCKVDKAQKLWW